MSRVSKAVYCLGLDSSIKHRDAYFNLFIFRLTRTVNNIGLRGWGGGAMRELYDGAHYTLCADAGQDGNVNSAFVPQEYHLQKGDTSVLSVRDV